MEPARIVHLLGGVTALDVGESAVTLATGLGNEFAQFPRPNYAHLYSSLWSLGLTPIGVEFRNPMSAQGLAAPQWECFFPIIGFGAMNEGRAWSSIRHNASTEGLPYIYDLASRCRTYLDLITIRLRQLSTAYGDTARSHVSQEWKPDELFSNTFMQEIDAGIHSFLADAGSFRDLLAEIAWYVISGEEGTVTRLSSFKTRTKTSDHQLAKVLSDAAMENGWIERLTNLRNNIVHVAPVGHANHIHSCTIRSCTIAKNLTAPILHYPLLQLNHSLPDTRTLSFPNTRENEDLIIKEIKAYSKYVASSVDALTYIWHTTYRLVELAKLIRTIAGFKSKELIITDDDIIGEPRFS